MPYNQQGLDLKALKTDPKMWMRLAMPSKNGKYLENVFKDKENPFEKNNQAAVETLEKLAAEGKLYLRDFGRSRHFQKVEKGDDGLKLGAQHEIKLSNSTAGFGLSVLMRLSRAYFKWIGLERISNWFDGRLKRRAELNELNSRYKEEYKSLTKEEKKAWVATQSGVTVGSDAFFPFGDNVERARKSGVQYICEPGGSIRDDHVIMTANKYGIVMAFTGMRLFHH